MFFKAGPNINWWSFVSDLVELKKKDIEQKVPYSFGYGINDTEEKQEET